MRTNPVLQESTAEEFALWKNSRYTKAFYRFLEDQLVHFRETSMDIWESGKLNGDYSNEVRGRVLTLREITELSLGQIQSFYQDQPEE